MSDKKYYMRYNEDNKELTDVTEDITEEIKDVNETEATEAVEEIEEVNEIETEAAPEVVKEKVETLVGIVTGCKKLNVRKEPAITAEPVCVVAEESIVVIDQKLSTDEWYKVYTETGVEGFCMKKYVSVSK